MEFGCNAARQTLSNVDCSWFPLALAVIIQIDKKEKRVALVSGCMRSMTNLHDLVFGVSAQIQVKFLIPVAASA